MGLRNGLIEFVNKFQDKISYAGQFTLYNDVLCFVNKIVKVGSLLYLISQFNIVVFCVSTVTGE